MDKQFASWAICLSMHRHIIASFDQPLSILCLS